ncbi:hypothetical protein B0H13DRAFT_1649561 [Mycena leptocephala]|nr:hypothetical protein B0H13DRAFT_1649561 [Mycena leptocephala]
MRPSYHSTEIFYAGAHRPSFSLSSIPRSDQVHGIPLVTSWEDHAIPIRAPEGHITYQCLWTTVEGRCTYASKKQSVKRHVEATHLQLKPFICDICSKPFSQKTPLDIHRNGHTGDTPHQCLYSCGQFFKDPARRHRHHVQFHAYIPQPRKPRL